MTVTVDETVWVIDSLPALWALADSCEERGRDVPHIRLAFNALGREFGDGDGEIETRDAAVKAIPKPLHRLAACVFAARVIDKMTDQRSIDAIICSLCYCDGLVDDKQMKTAAAGAAASDSVAWEASWEAASASVRWAALESAWAAGALAPSQAETFERRWQTGFAKWLTSKHGNFPS